VVAELNGILERLIAYWNRGPEADLESRLARLEKTREEARVLKELQRVVLAHGLVEFRGSLGMVVERLEEDVFEVGVFGRVSSGKSSLLNYLLERTVLPVGVTPVTAFPTRLKRGEEGNETVSFAEGKPEVIELSRLAEFVTEQQNPGNRKHVMRIEARVPARRLPEGVRFVDTPGLGSLATAGAEETMAYLPRCDLGLVLVDGASTVTHEDMVVVQALYLTGARVMVLLSKADLLRPDELREALGYVERQLETEARVRLKVFPVSVVGDSAGRSEEWLKDELMPLVDSHRQQSSSGVKRKIGALREAVTKVLEGRLGQEEASPSRKAMESEAVVALRKGDAYVEEAGRKGEPMLDGLWPPAEGVLDSAAEELARSWRARREIDGGEALAVAINRSLGGRVAALAEVLSGLKVELSQRLELGQKAAGGNLQSTEVLPRPRGAPIPDVEPLVSRVEVQPPPVIARLGDGLARRSFRRQLEAQTREGLDELWRSYRQQLRNWFERSRRELQGAFAARAAIYRVQLERGALGEANSSGTAMKEDLELLRKL
jgi:GTP-binding protein EngB required for normal cell division